MKCEDGRILPKPRDPAKGLELVETEIDTSLSGTADKLSVLGLLNLKPSFKTKIVKLQSSLSDSVINHKNTTFSRLYPFSLLDPCDRTAVLNYANALTDREVKLAQIASANKNLGSAIQTFRDEGVSRIEAETQLTAALKQVEDAQKQLKKNQLEIPQ